LLFTLAFWFGTQLQQLVENADKKVHEAKPYLIIAGLLAVGAYLLYHFLRGPVTTGDPHEIPIIGDQVAAKVGIPGAEHPMPPPSLNSCQSDNGKTAVPANLALNPTGSQVEQSSDT